MRDYSIDYNKLNSVVNKVEKNFHRYADVKHRLEVFAFDIVKFKDGNPDELWQIQNSDDGDYIVARYESEEPAAKTASLWETLVSNASGDITVFYKGQPITKIAAAKLGIEQEDMKTIKKFLPAKLASDKNFVKALLNTLDEPARDTIIKLYPELQ